MVKSISFALLIAGCSVAGCDSNNPQSGTFDAGLLPQVDATPAPDAAHCFAEPAQLLGNPGFDDGQAVWTEVGGPISYPATQIPVTPQAGERAAWLGRSAPIDQLMTQTITVPPGATSLTLDLYTCFVTEEMGDINDSLTIELRDSAGAPLETLASYSAVDAGNFCNWEPVTLTAASPHGGETVQFAIASHSDDGGLTSFYLDTLALTAGACPQ